VNERLSGQLMWQQGMPVCARMNHSITKYKGAGMPNSLAVNKLGVVFIAVAALLLSGCATSQNVLLAKGGQSKNVVSVARIEATSNSSDMNSIIETALMNEGITVSRSYPANTRTAAEVDALVSYADVWKWDMAMYLKEINIKLFDAGTGDLLVYGTWEQTGLHGFPNAQKIVQGLITEMVVKLRGSGATVGSNSKQPIQQNDSQSAKTTDTANKAGSANSSLSQKLHELQNARNDGLITEEEFQKKKQQLLDKY
jgi:major membrane immunogen (membrane-anchored lipoprotein)